MREGPLAGRSAVRGAETGPPRGVGAGKSQKTVLRRTTNVLTWQLGLCLTLDPVASTAEVRVPLLGSRSLSVCRAGDGSKPGKLQGVHWMERR